MKTILALSIFLISINLFSQNNRIYSVSINGGGLFPIEKLSNSIETGYNFGIDLETRKNNFGLFLSSKLNFVQYKSPSIILIKYGIEQDKKTFTIGEITAGGRWYLGKSDKLNANLDIGLGIYTGNYYDKIHWGFQPGIGANFPFIKNLAANLNVKVNVIEVDEWETYLGISLGLRYNFNM